MLDLYANLTTKREWTLTLKPALSQLYVLYAQSIDNGETL